MKKIFYILSALALMAGFTACGEKEGNGGGLDLDNIVLDGFYVYGEATGTDKVAAENAMAAGSNEVDKTVRTGMYEKYIWLEANKDFSLIENQAGVKKYYGATLTEVNYGYDENDENCKNFADNPNMKIQQGALVIGENAPKMRVSETGMYHIVLDNNANGDLEFPQIIIQKADWGVRGGMNGWGFTKGEAVKNADGTITYTWTGQNLAANGEFKFASCHGWKINLDEEGIVKAEVGLGLTDGKLSNTGGNIVAGEKAGLYTITLTYKCKAGAVADSFSYTIELTQESTTPDTMYIIGNDFGDWDWNAASVVEMTPVHSAEGCFWAVRYMTTATEFKFCALKAWNGDFAGLDTNTGFIASKKDDGSWNNSKVEADGLYLIYVDLLGKKVAVEPAAIYGMGPVFPNAMNGTSWLTKTAAFTVAADGKASITTGAAGDVRMYAAYSGANADDWWKWEFNIYDGKIVYRGGGNDQEAVPVEANKTITLDFNAGTGSIQ